MAETKKKIVVALGGNAILRKGEQGLFDEQWKNVQDTVAQLVPILKDANAHVIITHGNGPQVGNLLLQQAASSHAVPPMPMFLCGAMTQGQIGFLIQQAICEQCNRAGIKRKVATLMTHVAVDPQDAAFQKPSKPVGPFYTEEEAKKLGEETGHVFKEDAGKSWWRRVVASPQPLRVHEMDVIAGLADNGTAVIACGGGGIPVMEQGGLIKGVDAVIDKDRASALIADQWDADLFIILTAVEKVALYFKTDKERFLDSMSVKEAQQYLKDGHFPDGSMGPKIEAAISFVSKNKKRKAIITSPQKAFEAMEGKAGTSVVNG